MPRASKAAVKEEAAPELFPRSALPKDILLQPAPEPLPKPSRLRMGVHMSTSGGVSNAIARAARIGANTLQIFSSSPRMWRGQEISAEEAARLRELRERHAVGPLVIHANYLINCCSETVHFRAQSVVALRGEVVRAIQLGAEYLVLRPGSWKGMTRQQGLEAAAESIEEAFDGMPAAEHGLTLLIENTAGSEFSLGGGLEQVAESAGTAAAATEEAVDDDNVDLAAVLGGNIRKAPVAATEEEAEPEPAHAATGA